VRWRHGDTLAGPEAQADLGQKPPADLRARMDRLPPGHPSAADYPGRPSAESTWRHAMAGFAEAWQRHQERWPRTDQRPERKQPTTPVERELADGCEKIQAAEREITGRLQSIEARQSDRTLAGLKFCLKARERVIEKATEYLHEMPGFTSTQALAMVPDPVRYTFTYEADNYSDGVVADIDHLKTSGFEMLKLKNFWDDPDYKGINSQWRDTWTGQRFEVQFHTAISFECKQLTHGAYERLRNPATITDRRELTELHKLQREVTAQIPLPPGANYIRNEA
jgi:hypothetical protein